MRLRDRRAGFASLVLAAAYLGLVLGALILPGDWLAGAAPRPWPVLLRWLLAINLGLLVWRLAVRMVFVWQAYGAAEALRSVPRTVVATSLR